MPHRNTRNAAWQAASQWRARATQTRPNGLAGTVKLFFTWLLFGAMMIVAMVLGLFLLLVGWAMMPFVRHRMKKRMDAMRAQQATDIGSGSADREPPRARDALEGSYEVKQDDDTSR
ncbi:MAG: hypothetical protein L0J54_10850 [Halomonas sp.]|nr:hypothetical protein [Halomonas sp.]MDN6298500.1 hypothetical protein [Halomonas sp.]MDN6315802.1 hypothetical protein [Halomonas sp.]